MFRLYSKSCEYAIRALIHIGAARKGEKLAVRMVCRKAEIPEAFTRKVFQALVRKRFLKAVPGPGGGYSLRQHPREITVRDIIQAVEGEDTFDRCVMGLPMCHDKNPCPLHRSWINAKRWLISELDSRTLQDLIHAVQKGRPRKFKPCSIRTSKRR